MIARENSRREYWWLWLVALLAFAIDVFGDGRASTIAAVLIMCCVGARVVWHLWQIYIEGAE